MFNPGVSDTWSAANASLIASEPPDLNMNASLFKYGIDTAHLGSDSTFDNLFFELSDYEPQGSSASQFGLGSNSSALHDLYNAGSIISRSWSYYHGLTGAREAEGSLILGGYDSAILVSEANLTLPLSSVNVDDSCQSGSILVSNMELDWPNGTTTSVLTNYTQGGFRACIALSYNLVAGMDNSLYTNFLDLTGAKSLGESQSSISYAQMLVSSSTAFKGNLTFTLNDGDPRVTVPNDQLVTPEMGIDTKGQPYVIEPDGLVTKVQDFGPGSNPFFLFGSTFFSAASLIVEHDKDRFTISNAQPAAEQKLVVISGSNPNCNGNTSTSDSGPGPASHSTSSQKSLSGGAIAGVVIGSLIGAALIAALVGYFVRHRSFAKHGVGGSKIAGKGDFRAESENLQKPELAENHRQPRQEMPSMVEPSLQETAGNPVAEMVEGSTTEGRYGGVSEMEASQADKRRY